jgi:hypothetical protein
MFCPKCSNELPSDVTGFCFQCGLALHEIHPAFVRAEGLPPVPDAVALRRQSLRRGLQSLFCGVGLGVCGYLLLVATTVLGGSAAPGNLTREVPLFIGYLVFVCLALLAPALCVFGLARIIYALAQEKSPLAEPPATACPVAPKASAALPPTYRIPLRVWQCSINTHGLTGPLSVSEYTTRLL